MTGGRVVVLGPTGRNFAAGMSGGVAYVFDEQGEFRRHQCNTEMVELETVGQKKEIEFLKKLITNHVAYTVSPIAKSILDRWDACLSSFVKVMPVDYRRALERLAEESESA
jgi:glutamate synthase domain-containing protein 3